MYKKSDNIYNDLEMYKYRDIFKRVDAMQCSSTKGNKRKFYDTKINLYYEIGVKLKGELDQRVYKYDNLHKAITVTYFLSLLTQKEGYEDIEDYILYTNITDGKDSIIFEDATDNFHFWQPIITTQLRQENEALKEELKIYKDYLNQFKVDREKIKEYKKKAKMT